MTETGPCPLGTVDEDSDGCDGQVHLLFDGSVYCPTCETMFETEHVLQDDQLDMYDEEVRDLLEADVDELYEEHIRLLDLYYKEPLGFPDAESHRRFQTTFPLLVVKYIQSLKDHQEKTKKEIEKQLRKASRNRTRV